MEANGLVARRRGPANRRTQQVELTAAGEEAFQRMRRAAVGFDHRLRQGVTAVDLATATRVLDLLRHNVADDPTAGDDD